MSSRFESLRLLLAGFLSPVSEKRDLSYSSGQMEQIEKPMIEVMYGLWPHIQAAEYSLIVSDDMSGRIPTMVWRTLIDRVYEQKRIDPIATAYIETRKDDVFSLELVMELQRLAAQMQSKRPGTRALISTEHIGSGFRVRDIAGFLSVINVPYDVVSISTEKNPDAYEAFLDKDSKLFSGTIGVGSPIANLKPWEFNRARKDVPVMAALLLGHAQLFLPQTDLSGLRPIVGDSLEAGPGKQEHTK